MSSVRVALRDDQFLELRDLITARSGLEIRETQRLSLETSLSHRLDELRIGSFSNYLRLLSTGPFQADEFQELLLQTRVFDRSFFRYARQLDRVCAHLERLIDARQDTKRLRIWCPACSTGEEAYTIAILVHRAIGAALPDWHVEIMATDIGERALRFAEQARYEPTSFPVIDADLRRRYFVPDAGGFLVDAEVGSMVTFRQHAIADTLSARRFGVWDVVFCRDVIRWLDTRARQDVLWLFYEQLFDDGVCVLGPDESVHADGVPLRVADARSRAIYLPDAEESPDVG